MEYEQLVLKIDGILRPNESFDIIRRDFMLGDGSPAVYWAIDGLIDSDVLERVLEFAGRTSAADLAAKMPFTEVGATDDPNLAAAKVITGAAAFAVRDTDEVILVYARHYPERSIEEPDNEKVLRGARDGFCERLVPNVAMIRRRVKDPALTVELVQLGSETKTDTALVFLKGKCDEKLLANLRKRLGEYSASTLSFGEQTLAEYLVRRRWFDPFPKVRYTERPDSAAAMVLEGSIIVMCDNSPSAVILPTSIFDFLQDANDFYLPPVTATYLRLTRLAMALTTVFFLPVWYLVIYTPDALPDRFEFIRVSHESAIPIFWQIILVELIIDGLKVASLNTPHSLGNSVSVVMGLILGDLAVEIGWFVPEVILYMAFIAIANFAQPSYELGYALKFMRIMLLSFTALFKLWGLIAGVVVIGLLIVSNRTVDGSRGYLYPLKPWNGRAMKRFFARTRLKHK